MCAGAAANETLTEDCFNRHPLEFATPATHTLRFADPSHDRKVRATLVTAGAGTGWMIYPWPSGACPAGICDGAAMYVVGAGRHCFYPNGTRDNLSGAPIPGRTAGHYSEYWQYNCPACGAPQYLSDSACPCVHTSTSNTCPLVRPDAGSDLSFTPDPAPGHPTDSYALEDGLKVPASIRPGEYVLSYRWDCE